MKKFLSMLFAIIMVLAMVPLTAFAEDAGAVISDDGVATYAAGEYQGISIPAGSYIIVTVDATASAMKLVVDNGFGYWDWYIQAGMMPVYPSMRGSAEVALEAGSVYSLPIFNTNTEEEIIVGVSAEVNVVSVGTWENPDTLVMGDNVAEIAEGAEMPYFWNWTSIGNGDLYVEIISDLGWSYCVNNVSAGSYGDTHWSDDDPVVMSETIAVSEGDLIEINAITYDGYNPVPAGNVTIFAWFEPGQVEEEEEEEVEQPVITTPETVDYVNVDVPTGYNAAEGDEPVWVDITEEHTAVLGSDGYYHLDSENGPIIIVKMTNDNPYGVDLASIVGEGRMKIPVRNENNTVVAYHNTIEATKAYINAANNGWVYLTSDLIYIFQGYGAAQGWYMQGFSFFLNGVDFNADTAWMLSCATVGSGSEVEETVKGDLNGDGILDDKDVAQLLWHTLFPDAYSIEGNADFNGDGEIDDADVAYLLWHTLFPEAYPI